MKQHNDMNRFFSLSGGQKFRRASPFAALIAVALSAPGTVEAANLGTLTVQSGRNEPLRAEILVVAVNPAEAESLTAQLASRQSHEQAQVPYTAGTSALVLTLEPRTSNTMTILLRTREPVEEPTIAIVVELRSKLTEDTRPYRIDTTGVAQTAAPVVANKANNATTADSPTARAPQAASPSAPALAATQAASRAVRKSPTSSNQDNDVTSVAVAKGDTLAIIAARAKADDVALDRAMLAIFRANPKAFFGSIHQLKADQTLAIPAREAMLSNADSFIASELRRHSEIFQAYKTRVAAAPALANTSPTAQQAPSAGSAGGNARYDRLVLSKSNGGALAPDEQQTAIDNALKESNSRISELERNLGDLGKLAELKDRQIAQATATLKRLTSEPAAAVAAALPIVAAPPVVAAAPSIAAAPAAVSLSPAEAATAAAAAVSSANADASGVKPAVTPARKEAESSWWDYALYGGIALAALVAALLFKRLKSRRDPKAKFDKMVAQHSMFDTEDETDSKTLDTQDQWKKSSAKAARAEGPRTLKAEV